MIDFDNIDYKFIKKRLLDFLEINNKIVTLSKFDYKSFLSHCQDERIHQFYRF